MLLFFGGFSAGLAVSAVAVVLFLMLVGPVRQLRERLDSVTNERNLYRHRLELKALEAQRRIRLAEQRQHHAEAEVSRLQGEVIALSRKGATTVVATGAEGSPPAVFSSEPAPESQLELADAEQPSAVHAVVDDEQAEATLPASVEAADDGGHAAASVNGHTGSTTSESAIDRQDDASDPLAAAAPARKAHQLQAIRGIGPTYAARLAAAGVRTYADLARLDPDTVRAYIGVQSWQKVDTSRWIGDARSLVSEEPRG